MADAEMAERTPMMAAPWLPPIWWERRGRSSSARARRGAGRASERVRGPRAGSVVAELQKALRALVVERAACSRPMTSRAARLNRQRNRPQLPALVPALSVVQLRTRLARLVVAMRAHPALQRRCAPTKPPCRGTASRKSGRSRKSRADFHRVVTEAPTDAAAEGGLWSRKPIATACDSSQPWTNPGRSHRTALTAECFGILPGRMPHCGGKTRYGGTESRRPAKRCSVKKTPRRQHAARRRPTKPLEVW